MNLFRECLTSRKNPLIMDCAALQDRRGRADARRFLLEGEKLVWEAAAQGLPLVSLLISEEQKDRLLPMVEERFSAGQYAQTPLYILSASCFEKISSEKSPQGIIAVVKYLDNFKRLPIIYYEDVLPLAEDRILLLYDIQDPGNLGALLRSAVAFGIGTVIMSAACADLYSTKAIRAAMGCLFHLQVLTVEDFASVPTALQKAGRRVFAAELRPGAVSVRELQPTRSDCLLIGNEGHGILPLLSGLCSGSVFLPISENTESLNAAVAGGILLWEFHGRT